MLKSVPCLRFWYWSFVMAFVLGIWITGNDSFASETKSQTWDKLVVWETGKNLSTIIGPQLTDDELHMLEQMKSLPKGNSPHVIFQVEGKYFGYNSCSLEVFAWNGSQWEFFSGSKITGATCFNYTFFRNGTFFSLGGVGYWQVHSDLFQHTKGGNSVFTSVTHQPTSFVGSLFFQTERGLYSIFGNVMDIRKEQQHFVWEGYFLDLESKVWNSVEFDLNENFKEQFGAETFQQNWGIGGQFETADFAGIEIGTPILKPGWLIFDKRTSKLYVKEFNQSFLVGGSLQWTLIKGNTITVFPKYDLTPIEFDVEELVATAIPVGEIRVSDEVPQSEENRLEVDGTHLLLIFLNLIVLAALGGTIYYQKKKSIPLYQQGSSPSAEITGWTKKLEEFQGLVVTQETMDELLGIQGQKNPDIRKVSRSRAIRSINEQSEKETGHPLISRERDYRDKRVILYRVGVLKKTKSGTKQEVEIHSSYQ